MVLFGIKPGSFIQRPEYTHIGKNVRISHGVHIYSQNHDMSLPIDTNPDQMDEPKAVIIGDNCWIGAKAIILPGVKLGPNTIVGAGPVVTKSFPKGHCIIAGNPAKKIRDTIQDDK
jgi:acetyltransferase-like isoleucine patch superfamily enzyme